MRRSAPTLAIAACCAGTIAIGCAGSEPEKPLDGLADEPVFDGLAEGAREHAIKDLALARQSPGDASAVGSAAMTLHAYEQRKTAERLYSRAGELAPDDFRWTYLRGLVLTELGRYDEAVKAFERARQLESGGTLALLRLGFALLASGQLEEGSEVFSALARQWPQLAAAHYGLGRGLIERDRPAEAVEALERAAALLRDYGPLHYSMAVAYQAAGRPGEASRRMALYERLGPSRRPPFPDPLLAQVEERKHGSYLHHLHRGQRHEAAGRLADAVREYRRAADADPSTAQALVNLIAAHGKLGEFDDADLAYRQAVALQPDFGEAHYNHGVVRSLQGRHAEAAEAYRRALEANPLDAEAHVNLGAALEALGRPGQAERQYRKALQARPNFRLAHFRLGTHLFERGRRQDGLGHLRGTIEPEDGQTPQFLLVLARACRSAGDEAEARIHASAARRLAVRNGQPDLLALLDAEFPAQK